MPNTVPARRKLGRPLGSKTRPAGKRPAPVREPKPAPLAFAPPAFDPDVAAGPDVNPELVADPARLGEVSAELLAIARRIWAYDAQIARGGLSRLPRPFALRARALAEYVYHGTPMPDMIGPIR